jgi:hypothetical protein
MDEEIDMLWMLMRNTSKRKYCRKRRKTNNIMQLNEILFISQANGKK